MHRFGFALFVSLIFLVCARAVAGVLSAGADSQAGSPKGADTIHVDDDARGDWAPGDSALSDPQEDGTSAHPFDRIQEAIDAAADGAVIFVHAGTYREIINLVGKRIRLTGFDPTDPDTAAWPVIDGSGVGPVVTFTNGEDPNCVLSGFVVTGGRGPSAGAILCSQSSPTILNCLIVGNRATDPNGAAVHCVDSYATISNCTISDNYAGRDGAGLHVVDGDVTVANSILWNNTPREILIRGDALPEVRYTVVRGGWRGPGCIDIDPQFAGGGYWAIAGKAGGRAEPEDPDAIWIMGDYHVQSQAGRYDGKTRRWALDSAASPCIDAGDPACPVGWERPPNGDIINLGVYGGTAEAAKSPCDTPVHFPDAELKAAVEEELFLADPTPLDMLGLKQLISLGTYTHSNAIRDLTGLQYAGNLEDVNLPHHRISRLSPLSGSDVLREVGLRDNLVKDISPLLSMGNLQKLDLEQNEVVDISALSSLRSLQSVWLHRNFVSDVSPLTNLACLRYVDLRANPLNQAAHDIHLRQIAVNNPGVTLLYDPLFHGRLVISSTPGGSVVSPGEGEFRYAFYEIVELKAVADPGFEFVKWDGNYSTTDNPFTLLMDQDYTLQAVFRSISD